MLFCLVKVLTNILDTKDKEEKKKDHVSRKKCEVDANSFIFTAVKSLWGV